MKDRKKRICAKCGISPSEDPTVSLHRFPQPNKATKSRCELWAKFCYPDRAWSSLKFQKRLFNDHKMLCDRHFKTNSLVNSTKQIGKPIPQKKSYMAKQQNKTEKVHAKALAESKMEPDNEDDDNRSHEAHNKTQIYQEKLIHQTVEIEVPQTALKKVVNKPTVEANNLRTDKKDNAIRTLAHKSRTSGTDQRSKKSDLKLSIKKATLQFQKELDDASHVFFSRQAKYENNDECDLYGKLLSRKLRTYTAQERNQIMFKIDGLLIENPPGFDEIAYPVPEIPPFHELSRVSTSESATKHHSHAASTRKKVNHKPPPKSKKKSIKKYSISQSFDESMDPDKPSYTETAQVSSTSMLSLSPKKSFPSNHDQVKISRSLQSQPVKVTSSIPKQPVQVLSSIPKHWFPEALQKPLSISIPQTKVVKVARSKFVPGTNNSCGVIKIIKLKNSGKYVPSSQPPILITVPSSTSFACVRNEADTNALEQFSSIAATHGSSQYDMSYKEEVEMVDDMDVVSHEVVLESSN